MKRLYIFDFDNTLYLWEVPPALRRDYEMRLVSWLSLRKESGAIMAIASFNSSAQTLAEDMGIAHFMDVIIGNAKADEKPGMVAEIIARYPDVPISQVVYFDDDYDNVVGVRAWASMLCVLGKGLDSAPCLIR